MSMAVPSIQAVIVLDEDGSRIAAKYYSRTYAAYAKQTDLESKLYAKTQHRAPKTMLNVETILLDDIVAIYSSLADNSTLTIYIVIAPNENELIAFDVLLCITETLDKLIGAGTAQVTKRTIYDQYDLLLVIIDETIDDGMILETDSQQLIQRVALRQADGRSAASEIPLSEQNFSQALQTARDQLVRSFR